MKNQLKNKKGNLVLNLLKKNYRKIESALK